MTESVTKVLLKSNCPHCNKEILVEVENPAPIVKGILTEGDIVAAKEFVIKEITRRLEDGDMSQAEFDEAVKWVNEEETVFGPKDAQDVANSI